MLENAQCIINVIYDIPVLPNFIARLKVISKGLLFLKKDFDDFDKYQNAYCYSG